MTVSSWTLSREQTLDQTYFDRIAPIIRDTQGLLEEYYVNSDQSDESCFYIPEVDESQPVLFRGQCDEDIRGVENFDIEQVCTLVLRNFRFHNRDETLSQ